MEKYHVCTFGLFGGKIDPFVSLLNLKEGKFSNNLNGNWVFLENQNIWEAGIEPIIPGSRMEQRVACILEAHGSC